MSAVIIPFPAARRVDLVHSIARRALELTPVDGERHIERSLATQATVLRRKGVSQADIDRNLTGLAAAIRAVMWHAVMRPSEER